MKALYLTFVMGVALLRAGDPAGGFDSPVPTARTPQSFAWADLGAKATTQYSGDGLTVFADAQGQVRLRCAFQRLEGEATREGLWLTSTVPGAAARFRVVADRVGRGGGTLMALSDRGEVELQTGRARYGRRGLVEEYSVSADGVRQDFIVAEPPGGTGDLRLELALTGARAEAAADGVDLVLDGSGRKLAYSRLRVVDAKEHELAARMEVDADHRLAVLVADAGAVYPLRIDPTFSDANWVSMGGLPGANGEILAAAADGDGNLYVGGDFTLIGTVVANHIAKWDGSAWSALGSGMDKSVNALAVVGTNLYAGGDFYRAGGVSADGIAKWDGSTWSALGSGIYSRVNSLAVVGTNLYAGGYFTTAGGVKANHIAKWDGNAWSALGSGTDGYVFALTVSGTDLYVGGKFAKAGGVNASNIAKWDGTAWSALGSGINIFGQVSVLAVSETDLYAAGEFTSAGGVSASRIAKWDGNTWSALGSGLNDYVFTLAVLGTDIYAGGRFTSAGGASGADYIAKWDGSAWSAVASGMNDHVRFLAVSGADLYAGRYSISKWDGSVWSALDSGMNASVAALAVFGTDLYAGGGFKTAGEVSAKYIAKWDGSAWSALGSGMNASVAALAVFGTNLYAGGGFTTAGGVNANHIAKWDGSTWSALGPGLNGWVEALAASGTFVYTLATDQDTWNVSKWNGSAWSTLAEGGNDGWVYALAVSETDLYAGGTFRNLGGVSANSIAKWDGSAWSALGSGLNGGVSALAVWGTNLYAGGGFTTAGGVGASHIAKWDGSSWSALGSGMYGSVVALELSGTNLYAGGDFTTAGGVSANHIAKWDGSAWSALGSGLDGAPVALAVSRAVLYVGGGFTIAGGKVSAFAAKALLADFGANDVTYRRAAGSPLTIPIADVVWEVSGNPVTVQSLGSSVQGATLSYDSTNIYYLPANDSNDSFTYTVSNGTGTASGTITVTVTAPPNTVPVATPNTYTLLEDHSLAGNVLTDDTGNGVDLDADQDPLTAHVDTAPAHAQSFSLNAEGSFAYTPQAEFNGADAFTYHVNDGQADSPVVTVAITATPVNDAPGFTKGADVTTLEDSGPQSVSGWATSIYAGPIDEAGQTLTFAASTDQPALFAAGPSIAADGTLTYTPVTNANGVATVTVTLQDDGGTANGGVDTRHPQTFTIIVTAVNDVPSFVKGADQTVPEDAGPQSVAGWASGISAGPADEAGQTLTFALTPDQPALFAAGPSVTSDGALTYTPATNANGVATVTVTLKDDGGTANGGMDASIAETFTLTVTPVNDAPSFVKGADQTVLEDAGPQSVSAWATAISAGPVDEASQTLTFAVTTDIPTLFAAGPSIAADGTLTYTPVTNANGVATVTVTLKDDGGPANGGIDTSTPQTFTITVTAVNDAPSFVIGPDQTVNADAGAQVVAGWATAISAGPADEASQALAFAAGSSNPTLFAAPPTVSADGTLAYTPATDAHGDATITLTLQDDGGTANGGADTSAPQAFTITVQGPPPIMLTAITLSGGTFQFSWNAEAGRSYRVQYKASLDDAEWIDVGSPIVASGATASAEDAVSGREQRFYRVMTEN